MKKLLIRGIFLGLWCFLPPAVAEELATVAGQSAQSTSTDSTTSKSVVGIGQSVKNFALIGIDGKQHELNRVGDKMVVLFFTSIGCPITRKSIPKIVELNRKYKSKGVAFWIVDSILSDSREEIEKEYEKFFGVDYVPVLVDETQAVARMLGADRTAMTAVISLPHKKLLYRGAIDDQLSEDGEKPAPRFAYLQAAIDQILNAEPVFNAETITKGCLINYESVNQSGKAISYVTQIAPIIERKCANCHAEGKVAPFSFSSYQVVKAFSPMIEEVILSRRMPPWHADPKYGKFSNDLSLSLQEKRTILEWISQGAQGSLEGDPLLNQVTKKETSEWLYGEPDFVISVPEPQKIPAVGVLDYRYFKIPAPIDRDVWVGAIAYLPGNSKVVHHSQVFVEPENWPKNGLPNYAATIAGWAPGEVPQPYLKNAGYFLPKGSILNLEIHYNTTGKEEIDTTRVGFYLLNKPPKIELKSWDASDYQIDLPPFQSNIRSFSAGTIVDRSLLYALCPHMHLRGRSFSFELLTPDGKKETLLSVPNYDFKWQRTFYLQEPRVLPAGSVIVVKADFDNSSQNPSNPDPSVRVRWGIQSTDEMMQGYAIIGVKRPNKTK